MTLTVEDIKPQGNIVLDIKPKVSGVLDVKSNVLAPTNEETIHRDPLRKGMPIGLLLTLTYPVDDLNGGQRP